MELKKLSYDLTVCKVKEITPDDLRGELCFVGKTDRNERQKGQKR